MRVPPPSARARRVARTARADDVVAAARLVLERDGIDGLTMRSVADELRIKAPSLYKHVAGKGAIEIELMSVALAEMGEALHTALDATGTTAAADSCAPADAHGDDTNGNRADGDTHGVTNGGNDGGPERQIAALLAAYRRHALAHPNMYRLATAGRLPWDEPPAGLEGWAGAPFVTVTGDPHRGQALWSYAHGMVILELDGRYPDGSDLDQTWAEGAGAFAGIVGGSEPRRG
jgi:AcrR family transcriptional regulator